MLRVQYPRQLTADQEELLIAYFQSYTKKIAALFQQNAVILKSTGRAEYGTVFGNASERITLFLKLEKADEKEYIFMIDRSILLAVDIQGLPESVRRMMFGGPHGLWSKLSERMRVDLHGVVARRMGFKPDNVVVVLYE